MLATEINGITWYASKRRLYRGVTYKHIYWIDATGRNPPELWVTDRRTNFLDDLTAAIAVKGTQRQLAYGSFSYLLRFAEVHDACNS